MELVDIAPLIQKVWTTTSRYEISPNNETSIIKIEQKPTFIHPKLKSIQNIEESPIIIIAAPGAVGKTTFAKYFAFEKKSFYWDLSKIKLGDNTFIGTLAKTFGAKNLSKVLQDINDGNISLFIDAFDEAEIVSGWDGIEKFLREMYDHCKDSPHTNIVLFSRSETAEFIQMTLDGMEDSPKYSMFEIDYFDKTGAISLVKEFLRSSEDLTFETHAKPFERALDNIFAAIAYGMDGKDLDIWNDQEIRSFIGYSPVLQTIGSYLTKQNFEDVANTFEQQKSTSGGIEVIAKFIDFLLDREQQKFVSSIQSAVENSPADFNWGIIYTPRDQMKAIITYLLGNKKIEASLLKNIPAWLKDQYMTSISTFLPNHPFLRKGEFGPSFRDYSLGMLINDNEFGQICRQYMTSMNVVLTSLFAHYYHKTNDGLCLGNDAGLIYESSIAKRGIEDSAILTFIKQESNSQYSYEIIGSEGYKSSNLEFICIINESTPLVFPRRLYHAFIEIEHSIVLGQPGTSMELSDVEIKAKKIIMRAKEIYFDSHSNSSSSISAKEFVNEDFSLTIRHAGNGSLQFCWPGAEVYPWSDYFCTVDTEIYNSYKEELFAIRRILEPFRKHGKGEFAKQFEFIDNKMVGHVQVRKNMLDYLIKQKILSKNLTDRKYYINADILQKNGMNWGDLKQLNINNNLINFINGFKAIYGTN